MEVLLFTPPHDKNGFKKPTDVFVDFVECPKCNALNLETGTTTKCHLCGPGRIAFDEQVKSIYDDMLKKQEASKKLEATDATCKICNRVH